MKVRDESVVRQPGGGFFHEAGVEDEGGKGLDCKTSGDSRSQPCGDALPIFSPKNSRVVGLCPSNSDAFTLPFKGRTIGLFSRAAIPGPQPFVLRAKILAEGNWRWI
jgi:hypothetical protein